jgi:hypothetical protein
MLAEGRTELVPFVRAASVFAGPTFRFELQVGRGVGVIRAVSEER